MAVTAPQLHQQGKCWLCNKGEGSLEHLPFFCPVTLPLFDRILGKSWGIESFYPSETFPGFPLLTRVLHSNVLMRNVLQSKQQCGPYHPRLMRPILRLAEQALQGHQIGSLTGLDIDTPTEEEGDATQNWEEETIRCECPPTFSGGVKRLSLLQSLHPAIPHPRRNARVLVTTRDKARGTVILRTPGTARGPAWGKAFRPSPQPRAATLGETPTVKWRRKECECTGIRWELQTLGDLPEGAELVVPSHEVEGITKDRICLLANCDGGARPGKAPEDPPITGAGVTLWELRKRELPRLVRIKPVPLPNHTTNNEAEAIGAWKSQGTMRRTSLRRL